MGGVASSRASVHDEGVRSAQEAAIPGRDLAQLILLRGPEVLSLPPALFPALLAEAARQDAERRYLALLDRGHLGESTFGIKSRWVGKDAKPKSDWDYDSSEQQAYFAELRQLAGLSTPETPETAQAADNAAWASLRQARRIRA